MTKYFFKDKLYIYFGIVGRLENKEDNVWKNNGFDGKLGKLIGFNYCRLIPDIRLNLYYYRKSFEFGWLIFNSEIALYTN